MLALLAVSLAHPHEAALVVGLFAGAWGAQRWKNTTASHRAGITSSNVVQQQRCILTLMFAAAGSAAALSVLHVDAACAIAVGVTLILWALAMEVGRSHVVDNTDTLDQQGLVSKTASSAGFPSRSAASSGPFFPELFFTVVAAGSLAVAGLAVPSWADLPGAALTNTGHAVQRYFGLSPERRSRKGTPTHTPKAHPTKGPTSVPCPLDAVVRDLRAQGLAQSTAKRIADARAHFGLSCDIQEIAQLDGRLTYAVFGSATPTIVVDDGTQAHSAIYDGVVDTIRRQVRATDPDGAVSITQDVRAGKGRWLFLLTRDGSCRLLEKPDGTPKTTAYVFSEAETRWVVEHASAKGAFPMVTRGSPITKVDVSYYTAIDDAPGYRRDSHERLSATASGSIGCTEALSYLQTTGRALEDSAHAH